MKKLNTILLAFMACLFITSCHSDKMENESVFSGELRLSSLNPSLDVKVDTMNISRSAVDLSNYIVKIINSKQVETNKWVYGEMPEIVSLPVGMYTVQVSSTEAPETGIDKPFYQGEQGFEIKKNEITDIEPVVCKLANIRLSVSFDENIKDLSSDDLKITLSVGENSVELTKADEGKLVYLPALSEDNMLTVNLSGTIDGENVNQSEKINSVKKGYHHTINISLDGVHDGNGVPSGGLNLSVTVDGSLISEDDHISVNPGEEPGIDDFPTEDEGGDGGEGETSLSIVGTDFKGSPFDIDGEPLNIKLNETATLKVTLNSEKGLAHVYVTIDSETLTQEILQSVNLSDNFDLAEPGDLKDGLELLGLPTEDKVIGKNSVPFDITKFTPMMGIYGVASHNFILRIVDSEGAELTKTLKIKSVE